MRVQAVSDLDGRGGLLGGLDPGEAEALALAFDVRADLILIDEAAGRARAKVAGFETIGALGILLEAKHRGLVEALAPLLDELQGEHRFFIGPKLRAEVLRLAGEVP